jgi:hypothetical protein
MSDYITSAYWLPSKNMTPHLAPAVPGRDDHVCTCIMEQTLNFVPIIYPGDLGKDCEKSGRLGYYLRPESALNGKRWK